MIRFEEALAIVAENSPKMGTERLQLLESTGRVIAEDVFSDINMPPFNRSAVDGFACRREDLGQDLRVVETIRAGQAPSLETGHGQCTRIMTGSPVPDGADCVIMVEETAEISENIIRFTGNRTKDNISRFAEDIRNGDKVIEAGTMIRPQHIAIMAAVGYVSPLVAIRPKVAVISTGDEIVEPHLNPGISQIRNSNGYQLVEQVRKAGCIPDYLGIAADNEKDTLDRIRLAMQNNDVVMLTGGVSMGTFDFVPSVMEKAGIEILFRKIALQPGKPTIFGKKEDTRIFGLPGNPVSSFTLFEVLVKPMLWKMMGMAAFYKALRLPIGVPYERKRSDRMQWLPVNIRDGQVFTLEYHGSAHIFSLASADALAAVPFGVTKLEPGEFIDVRPI
jgi:molybdopterin molybdotransferase